MSLILAVVAAAAAAALWLPAIDRSRLRLSAGRPTSPESSRWRPIGPPALALGGGAVVLTLLRPAAHHLLVAATAAGVACAGVALSRRGGRRSRRAAMRRQAVDICDALVAELQAGQPPGRALAWAARTWPDLERVSTIAGLGGDVPAALRQIAGQPGGEPFAQIAAGWEVAHRSGAGLADVLDRLSKSLRDDEDVRREIGASLGPTRATGRLLALLPIFGLGLGLTMGADPLTVLLGSTLGAACLAGGAALAVGGLFWVERIADRAEP